MKAEQCLSIIEDFSWTQAYPRY